MADHTKGPWRKGKTAHSVVADAPIPGTEHTGHSDVEYYGGYLICESVWKKEDWNLITAAPDMYAALKAAEWVGVEKTGHVIYTVDYHCPVCGNRQEEGHAPECLLQQALAKAEGRNIDETA